MGSRDKYLSLFWGLVTCLIISCLSYCISLAIKPFLYSMNMLTVSFHSNTTLSNSIPWWWIIWFKLIARKTPTLFGRRTTVVITDWTRLTLKILKKSTQRKRCQSLWVTLTTVTLQEVFFPWKGITLVRIFSSLFTVNWKKNKNRVAWFNMGFEDESLHYEKLRLSWKKKVFLQEHCLRKRLLFYSIVSAKKKI